MYEPDRSPGPGFLHSSTHCHSLTEAKAPCRRASLRTLHSVRDPATLPVARAVAPAQDALEFFRPTFTMTDAQEKIKAREVIVAGALKDRFTKLSALLVSRNVC